jgi:acyl-CoA thioesterase YciA
MDAVPAPGPQGEVVIRAIAMPAEANPNGDVFGGWIMAQMDLGGAVLARARARSRVVTAAVDAMSFVAPVAIGDVVTCYALPPKIGRTSIKVKIEVWTQHFADAAPKKVTEGIFTYVAIDGAGKPHPVDRQQVKSHG